MSRQAVIDSNVLVTLIDSRDKWHRKALALHAVLKTEDISLIYFDCVLNETISVLARRAEEQKRSAEFHRLMGELLQQVPEDKVTWISAETQRLDEGIIALVRQTEGALNFHDALISLACQELGIPTIASFDEDLDCIAWLTRIADPGEVKRSFA